MEKLGYHPKLYGLFKGETMIGGYMVNAFKRGPLKFATGFPDIPYDGILVKKPRSKKISKIVTRYMEVLQEFAHFLESKFDYIKLLNHPSITDIRGFTWNSWKSSVRYTYQTQLDDIKRLEEKMDKHAMYEVRMAKKTKLV